MMALLTSSVSLSAGTSNEVEACFRCLKSELGRRSVYHQKTKRVTAHLFIALIAYHLVDTIRYQLKQKGIQLSWESLRDVLANQHRITLSMNTKKWRETSLRSGKNI